MGIINKTFEKPGVFEVITFGKKVFPNATPIDGWPSIYFHCPHENVLEISKWCNDQFGNKHWYKAGFLWMFTEPKSVLLFRLTWM